jgi:UDP-N-acetylglucosamine--N-acetylmuramyl-(pentapeptide) pyrophosphoryl-undecaprenol N-acetylglucosamine transferase
MSELKRVLIMTGGTGGHVFPGIAVARELQMHGITVAWLGTEKGMEARLVPAAGIPLHFISISGLRGKGFKALLLAPWKLLKAITQAAKVIRQFKPDIVLGMGGFVSGPGGIASWLLGYPLIIHEQNAKAGLTNKWLALVAAKVLEAFPDTFSARKKIITTGNPVRTEITVLPPPAQRFAGRSQPLHLLVIGGSLGAAAFNELVPKALALLDAKERPDVLHQTGEKHTAITQQNYVDLNLTATVQPFIEDMGSAYAWADVVLCRAGALTVAELCAAGLGAILVPYPYAVDDHQTANANYLVKNSAAMIIQQTELTPESLASIIKELSASPAKRTAMAQAAYQLRKIDATSNVLKICGEVCSGLDI